MQTVHYCHERLSIRRTPSTEDSYPSSIWSSGWTGGARQTTPESQSQPLNGFNEGNVVAVIFNYGVYTRLSVTSGEVGVNLCRGGQFAD